MYRKTLLWEGRDPCQHKIQATALTIIAFLFILDPDLLSFLFHSSLALLCEMMCRILFVLLTSSFFVCV